jgi:hypothetical protein
LILGKRKNETKHLLCVKHGKVRAWKKLKRKAVADVAGYQHPRCACPGSLLFQGRAFAG